MKVTVLSLVLFLAGCAAGGSVEEPVEEDSPAAVNGQVETGEARLRVTQHQLACCYIEGQVSYVQLLDGRDTLVIAREFRAQDMIQPVFDENLPSGTYTLRSWQRPCSGNCGSLDPPVNACELTLELPPDTTTFITSAFTPGIDCSLTETAEPPASPVPDEFALREPLAACGEEAPLVVFLGNPRRSPARICFFEAWTDGEQAEMTAFQPAGEDRLQRVYYRILPEGEIEVFAAPENPGSGATWSRYQCEGLAAVDDFRVFTLDECGTPEALEG